MNGIIITALMALCVCVTRAQLVEPDHSHYIMPARALNAWDIRGSIGAAISILPQPLTEYPTPAPMLDLRGRMGLPLNFQMYGRLGSNIATTLGQLGTMWTYNIGQLSLGVGGSGAFVYGNITYIYGFNTTQQRWSVYPMVSASYSFQKVTISSRLEAEYITSIAKDIGGQLVQSGAKRISGASLTFALEQPFFADKHIMVGFTISNSSDPYQAWFLYNTFKDRLFSSELFIGFLL